MSKGALEMQFLLPASLCIWSYLPGLTHFPTLLRGRLNPVAPQAKELASFFAAPTIYEHEAGHIVPSNSPSRKTLVAFIQACMAQGQI